MVVNKCENAQPVHVSFMVWYMQESVHKIEQRLFAQRKCDQLFALDTTLFCLSHQTCRLCWLVHFHARTRWGVLMNESTQDNLKKQHMFSKMLGLLSLNHDAQFGHPLSARRSKASKVYTLQHLLGRLIKSKEIGTVSLSPWSSVLHTVEGSRSCSLLQPNKSALKRDILARRSRDWRPPAVEATRSPPPLPGNWRELPVPASAPLRAGHTSRDDRGKSV